MDLRTTDEITLASSIIPSRLQVLRGTLEETGLVQGIHQPDNDVNPSSDDVIDIAYLISHKNTTHEAESGDETKTQILPWYQRSIPDLLSDLLWYAIRKSCELKRPCTHFFAPSIETVQTLRQEEEDRARRADNYLQEFEEYQTRRDRRRRVEAEERERTSRRRRERRMGSRAIGSGSDTGAMRWSMMSK